MTYKKINISVCFYIATLILSALTGLIAGSFYLPASEIFRTRTEAFRMGEPFRIGALEIVVHGIRFDPSGNEYFPLPPGYRFVIADMTITNTSGQMVEFVPLLHIHAKDSANKIYSVEPIPAESGQWSGKILSHDSVRQEIGFVMPEAETNISLYFETGTPKEEIGMVRSL